MIEVSNLSNSKFNLSIIEKIYEEFCLRHGFKSDVSLVFVDDARMREINNDYRGINKTTDVLSFEGLNEIFISLDQVLRQAEELKLDPERELYFIVAHGLLHLIGYNDDNEVDRLEMISLGNDILNSLEI